MVVSLDREAEAAMDLWTVGRIGAAQCAACQHGFLLLIETNSAEFLPVRNELVFDDNFVDREFSLGESLA
jgi:hypothetical protein